ncbi:MAG TPA: hypothetical protein GX497_14050 [Bacillus bacterium]|nr:hypothetical protein [Bacillus sp. (in: firmicutes)]
MLLASLLGTYLDLFFVGKGLYSFPIRPLPAIFSIHIAFTLVVLPVFAAVFLVVCNRLKSWKKAGLIILLSLIIAVAESWAESNGLLVHHQSWEHHYSFFGYMMFLTIIYSFYAWLK